MKTKLFTKLTAAALTLTLALTACAGPAPSYAPSLTGGPSKLMTAGQIADYYIQAADDYNPGADRAAVLEGLSETEQATRLHMFVMASRAFGDLPIPTGNGKNTAPPAVDLTDAPEWSWSALRSLSDGGVLAASDLGLTELGTASEGAEHDASNDQMNAPVTWKDAEIVAQRFFQAFSTNLKDNFYTAVNKNEMDALELPSDGSTVGGSSTVAANTNKQLHNLILEIVNSGANYPQGSAEQKIRDLYHSVLAVEQRNVAGVEPLQKYLGAVDAAKNFTELNAAIAWTVQELGNFGNGLFPIMAMTDTQDSSRKVM